MVWVKISSFNTTLSCLLLMDKHLIVRGIVNLRVKGN
jgi:hypothetical protein